MIAPERSLHPFEQCDAKLKLIVIWFPAFRGASLVHFFLTEFLLAIFPFVLIGRLVFQHSI